MNAIQKFKEGKKVGKYQNPAGPIKKVEDLGRDAFYHPLFRGSDGAIYRGRWEDQDYTMVAKPNEAYKIMRWGKIWTIPAGQKPVKKPVKKPVEKPAVSSASKSTVQKPNYAANFAGMNFSEDEKNFMTNAGYNPNDARSVQEFILSQASGANLGARGGAGIADGYWGDKSKTAFQALRDRGIFTPKEPVVDAPTVVETPQQPAPVIDASDPFGYESKGNYSLDNAGSLKTDGIRDWTTMMNYIKGNQDSAFSQDMMHRFGSDLSKWNQQDVESAMGVSGNYGKKDRSRIQGFMAGNQTAWNNQRQTAINDFAKKTFLQMNQGASTLGNTPGMGKDQLVQSMEGLAW